MVDRVWSTARSLGLGDMFRPQNGGYITDDHVPLLEKGIRAIDVIGFENYSRWHHTSQDTIDKMSGSVLADVGRLALSLLH